MRPGVTVLQLPSSLSISQAIDCFSDQPFLVLLDSAAHIRARDARYSFLTADPVATCCVPQVEYGDQPFSVLRSWQQLMPDATDAGLPPFCGGIAGLMSYELGRAFEKLPRSQADEFGTPALLAGLFDWCLVWDHIESSVQACVLALRDDRSVDGWTGSAGVSGTWPSADRQCERLKWIQRRLGQLDQPFAAGGMTHISAGESRASSQSELAAAVCGGYQLQLDGGHPVWSNFSSQQYIATVCRVVEYIRAGDIFQANLSQQLTAAWTGTAEELYRRVRDRNPAPFCGLLKTPEFSIVSASPERFLKVSRGRFVETRPIKGTRRRQQSPIADLFTSDELTGSEKDRAENIMIVDLLRNDLSRSCAVGSVRVTGLCEIERFQTVQHLVSTVVGELRGDADIWDLCSSCFPGGSITGAPKIRAMEIIAEMESVRRGAYCGSLFYAGPQSDFDSSILIRTFILKEGRVQFPVGGGIVADSDAADEYRETLHKASGMLRVLNDRSRIQ